MRPQTKKKLAALNSVTFIMVFGNALLIPGFPQIMAAVDISLFQVSLLVTGYSIAAGCFIPVFGFLSDHLKRKYVIIFALVLYGLGGTFIGALAALNWGGDIFLLILGGRVVQGIGAAGMSPIAMALVGDIFTTEERAKALGLIEFSNIAGKIVSPILGAALFLIVWYVPFFIYGLFVIPVLAAMLLLIDEPETKNKTPLKRYFSDIKNIISCQGKFLCGSYLGGFVSFLILFGVLAYLSDVVENMYSIKGILKGIVLSVPVTAWAASSFFCGFFLEKRFNILKILILSGLMLLTTTSILLSFFFSFYSLLVIIFFMGLAGGLIIPSLTILVTNCAPTEERGGIMSLYGSIRFFGVAVGPPLYTFLFHINRSIPFWVSSAMTAVLLIFFLTVKNKEIIEICEKNKP